MKLENLKIFFHVWVPAQHKKTMRKKFWVLNQQSFHRPSSVVFSYETFYFFTAAEKKNLLLRRSKDLLLSEQQLQNFLISPYHTLLHPSRPKREREENKKIMNANSRFVFCCAVLWTVLATLGFPSVYQFCTATHSSTCVLWELLKSQLMSSVCLSVRGQYIHHMYFRFSPHLSPACSWWCDVHKLCSCRLCLKPPSSYETQATCLFKIMVAFLPIYRSVHSFHFFFVFFFDSSMSSLDWQEYFSELQDMADALPCHIHLPVCLWIMDPHSRAPKPWKWGATAEYYTYHTKTMLPTRKSLPKIQQTIGPQEDLLMIIERHKLLWYSHVSHWSGPVKTILQGTVKGGRRKGR